MDEDAHVVVPGRDDPAGEAARLHQLSVHVVHVARARPLVEVVDVLRAEEERAAARRNAKGLLRGAAPIVRGVRILLGPLAHGLVLISSRVTPGGARAARPWMAGRRPRACVA